MTDKDYLKLAIAESQKGRPPHLYGAVVVKDDKVLSLEHSHTWELQDPSRHAEVSAISEACKKIGRHNIPGAVLYASHEPCLMCFMCAAWAEMDRIVFATPATQNGDSYELKGVSIFDIADKLQRKIKVERLEI